jgi:hypothetical protein
MDALDATQAAAEAASDAAVTGKDASLTHLATQDVAAPE